MKQVIYVKLAAMTNNRAVSFIGMFDYREY